MSIVKDGQRAAEAMMTLTLTATSPDPIVTTDADLMTTTVRTPQGTTPGKVAGPSAQTSDPATRTVTVGGVERPVMQAGLHIPLDSPAPADGWIYVVTALGPDDDTALLGRRYLVVSAPAKNNATARRLDVVEVPA